MTLLPDGTKFCNYTKHTVVLRDLKTGESWTIPMEPDAPLRLSTKRVRLARFLQCVEFTTPVHEPPERDGVYLIVSSPVKSALSRKRADLVTPIDLLRDSTDAVVACQCFAI